MRGRGGSALWSCLCCDAALLHLLSLLTRRSNEPGVQRLGFWTWLCRWLPCEPKSVPVRSPVAPVESQPAILVI